MQSLCNHQASRVCAHRHQAPVARSSVAVAAKKGFGSPTKQAKPQPKPRNEAGSEAAPQAASTAAPAPAAAEATAPAAAAAAAAPPPVDKEEEIEAMLRRRKNRKVEPQVKVQSAAVDMATGKAPTTPVGEAETRVVSALSAFFFLLLVEGLLLASSGFLPADWDSFIQDVIYPSYSPQMLLFVGMSSAYGLWKTGKLPGQKQIK